MTTIYRTRINKHPRTKDAPEYWRVELLTHTEDGPQVEFVGEYFNEQDAHDMATVWRHEKTRKTVELCAALIRPNQGEEG
jgi:hypothetical protein